LHRAVSVSGYLIESQEAGRRPLPPEDELQWWPSTIATERGRAGYDTYRRDFGKLIWRTASPKWTFDDATFDRRAAAFDNPDHVEIVIHNQTKPVQHLQKLRQSRPRERNDALGG
jgi:hypothetical protein